MSYLGFRGRDDTPVLRTAVGNGSTFFPEWVSEIAHPESDFVPMLLRQRATNTLFDRFVICDHHPVLSFLGPLAEAQIEEDGTAPFILFENSERHGKQNVLSVSQHP